VNEVSCPIAHAGTPTQDLRLKRSLLYQEPYRKNFRLRVSQLLLFIVKNYIKT